MFKKASEPYLILERDHTSKNFVIMKNYQSKKDAKDYFKTLPVYESGDKHSYYLVQVKGKTLGV